MVWYIVIGTLAAFGALCVLWIVFGFLLTGGPGADCVCLCCRRRAAALRRRYRWLRELGLVRGQLLVTCELSEATEFLQQQWEKMDGAGIGDPPGHHQRGGVSEL